MRTATATLAPEATEAHGRAGASASVATLAPGRRLGSYELLLPLASGGMGHVWTGARLGEFGFRRRVAIKVMREELAQNAEFRRRFLDEARLVSSILHTNVVEIIDLGADGDVLYQAMALVDGASLQDLATTHRDKATGRIPTGIGARIVLDALRGLHAAHELRDEGGRRVQLVHRDVSPHNVLVGLDGVSKITDFGIAHAIGESIATLAAPAEGKLGYMAPEQMRGGAVDRRADLFAMGVILWELLAGTRLPAPARTLLDGGTIPLPPTSSEPAATALASVAMQALALEPEARFPTAEAMADAIERVAEQTGLAASTKAVSSWAATLVSDRVRARNDDADAQLARSMFRAAEPRDGALAYAPTEVAPKPQRATSRIPLALGLVFVVVIVGAIAVLVDLRFRSAARVAAPEPLASTAAPPSPPASATSTAPVVPATPSDDPAPTASAPASRPFRRPARGTIAPAHAPSSAPPPLTATPKFDNPYAK